MDAKSLDATKASEAKWWRNAEAKTPKEYLTGSKDCPLCELFYAGDCIGCPVFEKTGRRFCVGSPYRDAVRARWQWQESETDANRDAAHAVARTEAEFIHSLLPAESQP